MQAQVGGRKRRSECPLRARSWACGKGWVRHWLSSLRCSGNRGQSLSVGVMLPPLHAVYATFTHLFLQLRHEPWLPVVDQDRLLFESMPR